MQWREGNRRFELRQDGIVDEAMLAKLWAAVNNSMPDCIWLRQFGVNEKPSYANDRFPLVRNGSRLGDQRISVASSAWNLAP